MKMFKILIDLAFWLSLILQIVIVIFYHHVEPERIALLGFLIAYAAADKIADAIKDLRTVEIVVTVKQKE